MNSSRPRRLALAGITLALTATTLLGSAATSSAGATEQPRPHRPPAHTTDTDTDDRVVPAPRALTRQQAHWRSAEKRVARAVGDSGAGSYVDRQGRLVTTVTTEAAADAARSAGARTIRVDDPARRLDRIMDVLNDWSRSHRVGSVQGWRLDVPTNSVVVTLTRGASDRTAQALVARARTFGDSVRFEERAARVRAAESIYGGLEYRYAISGGYNWCSVGFTAIDAANRPVLLTAGHCLAGRASVYRNGYTIGSVRSWRFGGEDWAVVNNSYPGYWVPYAHVARYNGTTMAVRGLWTNPMPGTPICKSGRTTGWTCGSITATNVTQAYNGKVVYGLVRHTACTEGGDSGGSVVSTGGYALGLTAASAGYATAGGKVCGQRLGYANESYYQPIGPVLSSSGTRMLYVP